MVRKSRRKPLSQWTDRGLHMTAHRLRRLIAQGEATRKQDWLFTMLVNEMEFRYKHQRPSLCLGDLDQWRCWGCELCRSHCHLMAGQQHLLMEDIVES